MTRRLLRYLLTGRLADIMAGDFVRYRGKVGLVESVDDDHATVAWAKDKRDILPLVALRRVRDGGSRYDRRGE